MFCVLFTLSHPDFSWMDTNLPYYKFLKRLLFIIFEKAESEVVNLVNNFCAKGQLTVETYDTTNNKLPKS